MRETFAPLTVVPGARRRIDPVTHMTTNVNGLPLWDLPAPIRYVEHKSVSKSGIDTIMVPIYRGTSAAYARWVKSQIRRKQRKDAKAQAASGHPKRALVGAASV